MEVAILLLLGLSYSCCDSARAQTYLTIADKLELQSAHNQYRGTVRPRATNMERMVTTPEALLLCSMAVIQLHILCIVPSARKLP